MTKWDERYQTEEYIFGTEPNEFIARIQPYLPTSGRALDLATGEGRNGIFLARHGFRNGRRGSLSSRIAKSASVSASLSGAIHDKIGKYC